MKILQETGSLLAFVGFFCCVVSFFVQKAPFTSPSLNTSRFSKIKQVAVLLAGQSALLLISFALFYLLEIQTQTNMRLHGMETAYIVRSIQQDPFNLGLLPWLLYSVLGIGLFYISFTYNRVPLLSRVILWKKRGKFGSFFHNMPGTVTDIVTMGPFLFVASLALIWFCEIVNIFLKQDSLFLTPLRTTFICGLVIIVLRKPNVQLIEWMNRYQSSVAKTLMICIFAVSFFILWLHSCADWLPLGTEVTDLNRVLKSSLAGSFSEHALQSRIHLLIWGWWGIWIPWMTSLVARSAIGFSVLQAFLQSLLLPLLLFSVVLSKVTMGQWLAFYAWFKMPAIQILAFMGLLLFVIKAWGNMVTLGDVARGAMIPMGRLTKRPLKRWMHYLIMGLIAYIPGWMMLGWLPMQFFVSLEAIFMLIVVALFIFAWAASLYRQCLLKKNKAEQLT